MGTVGVSSPEELSNVCGYLLGIILSTRVCEAAGERSETEVSWNWVGTPLPPSRLKVLLGAGSAKTCLQNLGVKELIGQNPESKGVTGAGLSRAFTASALTILR